MIGEIAVGVEKLTARSIRAQRFKHAFDVKGARAVSCVHDDFNAVKRLVPAAFALNQPRQKIAVVRHIIVFYHFAFFGRHEFFFTGSKLENFFYLTALESARRQEKLKAVFIARVMRSGNHDRSGSFGRGEFRHHEHGRRRTQSAVKHRVTRVRKRLCRNFFYGRRRKARVATHSHGFTRYSSLKPESERVHNGAHRLFGKINLASVTAKRGTAYVCTAFQFFQFHDSSSLN